MHPTVIQNAPGTCPVCAMELVRKGQPGEEVKITATLNYLLKPSNAMVISTIKTVMPVHKTMEVMSKASGTITYDTRQFTSVPIRFGGRIEKLGVKYNFQPVRKGQKILEIYSPELMTAQQDLLYLLKSDKENTQLVDGAKQKLVLLGISDSQINELTSTRKEIYSFPVYSPVDGYIVEVTTPRSGGNTSPQQSSGAAMDGGMESAGSLRLPQTAGSSQSSELRIREGMYVVEGQVIFTVINTEFVWAEFDVSGQEASFISKNSPITITFDNSGETINARVDFVQPFFKDGEKFSKVRIYLQNKTNKYQVGQLVTGLFTSASKSAYWIPVSARLDLGEREISFIKRRGVFRPTYVVTLRQSGDWLEVVNGLVPTDSVAYNAQFLVDSESFIKVRN